MPYPTIPEYITVHLGAPDSSARNVRVPFTDYIKNVASSEIYPTWPESAIRANILAQITFALNRVYTEWYRSRGYDFDITSSTSFDQYYVHERDVFENISKIVDEIFNNYVVKQGSIEPYFTQYCNGTTVRCNGLSQWGTVDLARQGKTPYEILQYYYGDNINIVKDAPIGKNVPSYPGVPLRRGTAGEDVRTIQRELNRIARNYPSIPKISNITGIFDQQTENAVKAFQRIFNLTQDGIVGKATWYKIKSIYNGVKGLSELYSEGLTYSEAQREFPRLLKQGDSGNGVRVLQYFLSFIGYFDDAIPKINVDGSFGSATTNAIKTFQKKYGLTVDGEVGQSTWNKILDAYSAIVRTLPSDYRAAQTHLFPGEFLAKGSSGNAVRLMQQYLDKIAQSDPNIPRVNVTGTFDDATERAVKVIQSQYGYPQNGAIGPLVWSAIVSRYYEITG